MKRIAVIAPYVALPGEVGAGSRFAYLCRLLTERGFEVELFTSSFSHARKAQRDIGTEESRSVPYKVHFVHEPGYPKNIDLRRILSHRVFSQNLRKCLDKHSGVDAVYCAVPTPDSAVVSGQYASRHGVPFIIDVQDLWPEAMRVVMGVPILSNLVTLPLKLSSEKAYSMADYIIAVSDTYRDRAVRSNDKCRMSATVYLGVDMADFDKGVQDHSPEVAKPQGEFWVTYVGTLGASYDIRTLIAAVAALERSGLTNIKLHLLGDGPMRGELENFALGSEVDVVFHGMLPYGLMAAYLEKSDIAVNAIRKRAAQSITNKIGDYLSAGRPIANSSGNSEFMQLVEEYQIGRNCEPENPESLAAVIRTLYHDEAARVAMGQNARRLASERFDRNTSYGSIVDIVTEAIETNTA